MEFITRNYYEIMGILLLGAFIKGYLIVKELLKEESSPKMPVNFFFHFLNSVTYVVTGILWVVAVVYIFFEELREKIKNSKALSNTIKPSLKK